MPLSFPRGEAATFHPHFELLYIPVVALPPTNAWHSSLAAISPSISAAPIHRDGKRHLPLVTTGMWVQGLALALVYNM